VGEGTVIFRYIRGWWFGSCVI